MRITKADLEFQVKEINEITGNSVEPYSKNIDRGKGRLKANIGNYHLDWDYGGVILVQMVTDGGGIRDISTIGRANKRELSYWLGAFRLGLKTNNL